MKALEHCQWVPRWVSHMGCLKGCLNFLGIEISDAWLYGGTGHAFVINLHDEVCPSGPTAWDYGPLFGLGSNLGYTVDGVFGSKDQDDFAEIQARAYEFVRQSIDEGRPCYGWELEIPEFYVVYGYDDAAGGYFYSGPGCDEGKGPKAWRELGDTGIGIVEIHSVTLGEATDDEKTVKDALTFAVQFAADPRDRVFEHYASGLKGFDDWISALREGKASDMGMRYNVGVWLECRQNASGFLKEAKERLPGRVDNLFDEAAAHYDVVSENLGKVAALYPWSFETSDEEVLPVDETSEAAAMALQSAREAEAAALKALETIVSVL